MTPPFLPLPPLSEQFGLMMVPKSKPMGFCIILVAVWRLGRELRPHGFTELMLVTE